MALEFGGYVVAKCYIDRTCAGGVGRAEARADTARWSTSPGGGAVIGNPRSDEVLYGVGHGIRLVSG